jgi:hypothetical protein
MKPPTRLAAPASSDDRTRVCGNVLVGAVGQLDNLLYSAYSAHCLDICYASTCDQINLRPQGTTISAMRSEPAVLAQERLLASSGVEILHIPLPTVPGSRERSHGSSRCWRTECG